MPPGTVLAPGGFVTFYETNFGVGPTAFHFASDGDQAFVFSGDGANLSGYWQGFEFGASPNGVAFGRWINSAGGGHFVAASARTESAANAYPLVGAVVVSEIMYHPPDRADIRFTGTDNAADEFVELHNTASTNVGLFHPAAATNTWRLRGDTDFDFPGGVTLAPDERVLVVGFDVTDPGLLAMFRMIWNVPPTTRVFGPWQKKLANNQGAVALQRPDFPNSNGVPYILIERVDYDDDAPWPAAADGLGLSLHRCSETGYANDATNWVAAPPTAGTAKPSGVAPVFTLQPVSQVVTAGVTFTLTAAATGDAPLTWRWRWNGTPLPSCTNSSLVLPAVGLAEAGVYEAIVFNAAGSALSAPATLTVLTPATILVPPVNANIITGSNGTLSVLALGTPPFSYQWRKESNALAGATSTNLLFNNAQLADAGN